LEKWASEQEQVIADLKTDLVTIKESLLDFKEIKDMLKELKKRDEVSEGRANLLNA